MRLKISIRNKKGEILFPDQETGTFIQGDDVTIRFNITAGVPDMVSKSSRKEAEKMIRRMVMAEIDHIIIEGVE